MDNLVLVKRIEELETKLAMAQQKLSTDPLTGCLRREAIMEIIQERLRMGIAPSDLNVVLIDIDHFKSINDRHGHLVGDAALRFLGNLLKKSLPENGLCARFGGEEFVLVLEGTNNDVEEQLEHLRLVIEQSTIQINPQTSISFTASFGVARWRTMEPMLKALGEADHALYQAKRAGRNCLRRKEIA